MTASGQAAALTADGSFEPDPYKESFNCPAPTPPSAPAPAPSSSVECKIFAVPGMAEVTIPSSSVSDEKCCSLLQASIYASVAVNPMLSAMGGWGALGGMLGVTSCIVPSEFGQCGADPANIGDETSLASVRSHLCSTWDVCNTAGMTASGQAAALTADGSF